MITYGKGYLKTSGLGIAFIVRSYLHFSVVVSEEFLAHSPIKCEWFYYISPIDENLTSTTTPFQSGPGSNGNEGVVYTT